MAAVTPRLGYHGKLPSLIDGAAIELSLLARDVQICIQKAKTTSFGMGSSGR